MTDTSMNTQNGARCIGPAILAYYSQMEMDGPVFSFVVVVGGATLISFLIPPSLHVRRKHLDRGATENSALRGCPEARCHKFIPPELLAVPPEPGPGR